MNNIKVTKPGKLFLMGEYAVVYGHHALITPTEWKITVTMTPSDRFTIESTKWPSPIYFEFSGNHIQTDHKSVWTKPVETMHKFASELDIIIKPYHLKIESELDQSIDHKWGLGSSGALTVALIDAISTYINDALTPLEHYKLAVISQLENIDLTSFGDLACSSFDQPILYRRPNKNYLEDLKDKAILDVLNETWPNLIINPILNIQLPLLVIHSNMQADSHNLVRQVFQAKNKTEFPKLMDAMNEVVLKSYEAWQNNDMQTYKKGMHAYHHQLLELESLTKTTLMTKPLKYLSEFAFKHQITHKFSGAGGGDNMLYFIDEPTQKELIETNIAPTYPILNPYMKGIQK